MSDVEYRVTETYGEMKLQPEHYAVRRTATGGFELTSDSGVRIACSDQASFDEMKWAILLADPYARFEVRP